MDITIHRDGQNYGPYTLEQIQEYLGNGSLDETDLAWYEGCKDWLPLKDVITPVTTPPPPPPKITASSIAVPLTIKHKSAVDIPGISPNRLGAYARSNLQASETPLFKTTLHWIIFVIPGFLALSILCMLSIFIICGDYQFIVGTIITLVITLTPSIINYICSEFVITNQRVLIKVGFISRRTLELFISKIESIGIDQGILGRLFGYGTVTIRGTGGSVEHFTKIANPFEFRSCVQNIQVQLESK